LLLARDRLGIKPLYLARVGELLVFASELKGILAHPLVPAGLQLSDLAQDDTLGALRSYAQGVEHLPGGHALSQRPGQAPRLRRWWALGEPPAGSAGDAGGTDELVATYRQLLHESVQEHLMSEVPLGIMLSGGIDSSAVAALAVAAQRDLHCFHITHPSIAHAGDSARAAALASSLDRPLHVLQIGTATALDALDFSVDAFVDLVAVIEQPRFDLEFLFKRELHRAVKRAFPALKVMLLGQGADEFTGGYSRPQLGRHPDWASYLGRELRQQLAAAASARCGVPAHLARLLAPGPRLGLPAEDAPLFAREMHGRLVTLQAHNLWHEDRTSSAHAIEARVPFLDHRLVEFLASVPPALHPELFWDKNVLRRAVRPWLGTHADSPKVPFYESQELSGLARLLRQLAVRIYPAFAERYLQADALLDRGTLQRLYEQAQVHRPHGTAAAARLVAAMAIGVFDELCRTRFAAHRPVDCAGLALEVAQDGAPVAPDAPPPAVQVAPADTIRLRPGVQLLHSLADPERAIVLREGVVIEELAIDGAAGHAAILAWLARRPEGATPLEAAAGLALDTAEVCTVAAVLVEIGAAVVHTPAP
jgi:asparagine synthase (glutamine-hydrolysing)